MEGSKRIVFTGVESTYVLPYFATTYVIWSPDDDFQIQEDEAIDADSFLVPQDTLFSIAHGVKELHIKAAGVGGIAWMKYIVQSIHAPDTEIATFRGGIDTP